ncbi:MAG: hypothetical protein QM791_09210 [Ferruginibacter sp.]
MKKIFLALLVTGGSFAALAQNPSVIDTSRQYNNPDSLRLTPDPNQAIDTSAKLTNPVATDPSAVPVPAPVIAEPANSNVSNPPDSTVANPAPVATENPVTTESTAAPVTTPEATNTPVENTVQPTVPATQTDMQNSMNTTNALPRGVNVDWSAASSSGLGKWSALPILNTWVPQPVVDQMKSQYGDKLYDITTLKIGDNQYAYSARIQENGVYKAVMVNDAGNSTSQQ